MNADIIGLFSYLTLSGLLIVLKLCHVINWSWWWVLLPIETPIVIVLAVIIVLFINLIIESLK